LRWQRDGGPCGVLAALQAALLCQLLWQLPPEPGATGAVRATTAPHH
jgi:hypothetical protein